MKSERIKLFYGIFLSGLTVVTALTFIVQVADIYYGGPNANHLHNYSAEIVKEHLVLPLIFLCIWIAAIIAGFVLSVISPVKIKSKNAANSRNLLSKLMAIMPDDDSPEIKNIKKTLTKYEVLRLILFDITLVACLAVALYTLTYTLDPSHYSTTEFLKDMLDFLRDVLIYIAVAFVVICLFLVAESVCIKKETQAVKKAIALKGKGNGATFKDNRAFSIYVIIPAVALVFILISAIFKVSVSMLVLYAAVAALLEIVCLITELYRNGFIKRIPLTQKRVSANLLVTRLAVGVVAVVFIILGIVNGGASDVLIKAVKICTECIGLG